MSKIHAFLDEYGAFGWNIKDSNVSTHFIITAIIVNDEDLNEFSDAAEEIRRMEYIGVHRGRFCLHTRGLSCIKTRF